MRVAVYNQMFGLNGKNPLSNLLGHWAVHFQSDKKQILKRTDIQRTLDIVKESKADIIGICEVLDYQYKILAKKLHKIGYKWTYFGKGHKLSHYNIFVGEMIASKVPCKRISIRGWTVDNRIGGGGGLGAVYIPKLKTTFFNVHLALSTSKYFYSQIRFIADKINKIKGKIILTGDFNLEYYKIKKYFPELKLVSEENKTCSLTPILKCFCWKDYDHILVRGWNKKKIGAICGYSDHKLVYADLE